MMNEWREVRLGDIATVKGGKRLPNGVCLQVVRTSHPYIRVRDLNNKKNLYLSNDFEYVDDETQKAIARYIVSSGDIVISIVGTIGLVCIIDKSLNNANLTENCVKLVELTGVDRDYLYYFLISNLGRNEIKKGTVGAVQAKLPLKNIQNICILLPPLPEQKAIADTLSCLDDKIELNNRINANLEQTAQAIFKSWFVDFEPFQDGEFVDSELGRIPKGWRVGTLGEILNSIKTATKAGEFTELPYLPIDIIPMNSLSLTDYKPNEEAQSSLITFKKDDILIGAMRVYFHRVCISPFQGITRTTCFVLRVKNPDYLEYALLLCNQNSTIDYAQNTSKGSTMPYAVWENALSNMKILIPPSAIIKRFSDIISPSVKLIRDSIFENKTLKDLRDSLLPKLMSGEIDVM